MLKLPCILSSLICLFVKLNRSSLFRFSWGEGVYFWWCYCFKILMRALETVLFVYLWPQEQLQQIRQIMGHCRRILGDTIYKKVFRDISISSIPEEEYMSSLLFSYCLLEGFFMLKGFKNLKDLIKSISNGHEIFESCLWLPYPALCLSRQTDTDSHLLPLLRLSSRPPCGPPLLQMWDLIQQTVSSLLHQNRITQPMHGAAWTGEAFQVKIISLERYRRWKHCDKLQ